MEQKVVYIEDRNKLRGIRGSLDNKDDIIEERRVKESEPTTEIQAALDETTSDIVSENGDKGASRMEITPKEYIDDRISALEKSIDHKFDSQEKLLSEKIDHLHTKIEGTISEKLSNFKSESDRERKEDKRFYVGTAIALSAVVVALLGFVF